MQPHPPLGVHYTTTETKPAFVNHLFDAGAKHYDPVVDWGFLKSGAFYRRWALQRHGLRPGHQLLDVLRHRASRRGGAKNSRLG